MSKNAQQQMLILGGGLAGSFMACRLLQAGMAVTVIDDRHPASASRVAAGLYNVITGRFGVKSWMADTLLQEISEMVSDPFFEGISQFIHPIQIYRPFKNIEDYNHWTGKSVEPSYRHLVQFEENPLLPELIENPLGGIRILPCGWVDISGLIDFLHRLIELQGGKIFYQNVLYEKISLDRRIYSLEQQSIRFDHLICCEGHRIRQNPWFEAIPVQPNKGEILEIHAPKLRELPFVITRKVYLVPGGGDQWIVGSTYKNHFDSPEPSEAGKQEILDSLNLVLKIPYTITGHRAGIRPTSPNRRPILGSHPDWAFLHTLTGFGTKGMLAAPWSSKLLTAHILGQKPEIPDDVKISRFKAFR